MFSNRAYLACLFLDARYNVLLTGNECSEEVKAIVNFKLQLRKFGHSQPTGTGTFDQHNKRRCFENQRGNSIPYGIHSVLDEFEKEELLPRTANILKYWHSNTKGPFHHLAELANIVYSVCPTQVNVERSFSTLRFILRDLWRRMSDAHLDILLVKKNYL